MRNQALARERAAAAALDAANRQTAPEEAAKGSLDITSTPDGCAIWINGDLRQETTPAKIEGLPLGTELSLKLTKDGLEAHRESLTLTSTEPSKKVAAEMRAGSVTVLLKIDPPPSVWVDGKPWKGDRTKVDGLSAGEEHKIVVAANGYAAKTFIFTAKQGETRTIADRLMRGAGGEASPASAEKAPPPEAKEAPAAQGGGAAKVRVGAKGGFCNVTVNGASVGPTPVEAAVTAGNVRISCKPATGPTMSQTIKVGPGETGRVSFKIDQ